MGRARLFVLLPLAACGRIDFDPAAPPYDPNGGATSGTRLKLRWYEFPDGTRAPDGAFDTQRQEPCSMLPWSDGNTYCTPQLQPLAYTDAACSQPVEVPHGTEPYFGEASCNAVTRVYETGPQISDMATFQFFAHSCVGPSASSPVYAVGAPLIAATELAVVSLAPALGGDRIGLRDYTMPDGFASPATLHDASLGVDCFEQRYNGGFACSPSPGVTEVYGNAQCSQLVSLQLGGCPAPPYGGFEDPNTCVDHIGPLGAKLALSTIYSTSGGSCMPSPAPQGDDLYALGSDIAAAPLARVTEAAPAHRLQRIYFVGDGAQVLDSPLYDTTLGAECIAHAASDGVVRCIPSDNATPATYWSDAACTTSIVVAIADRLACSPSSPLPSYAVDPTTQIVYPLAAPYTGSLYQMGSCMPYTPPAGAVPYTLGAAVDPAALSPATMVTDP